MFSLPDRATPPLGTWGEMSGGVAAFRLEPVRRPVILFFVGLVGRVGLVGLVGLAGRGGNRLRRGSPRLGSLLEGTPVVFGGGCLGGRLSDRSLFDGRSDLGVHPLPDLLDGGVRQLRRELLEPLAEAVGLVLFDLRLRATTPRLGRVLLRLARSRFLL